MQCSSVDRFFAVVCLLVFYLTRAIGRSAEVNVLQQYRYRSAEQRATCLRYGSLQLYPRHPRGRHDDLNATQLPYLEHGSVTLNVISRPILREVRAPSNRLERRQQFPKHSARDTLPFADDSAVFREAYGALIRTKRW